MPGSTEEILNSGGNRRALRGDAATQGGIYGSVGATLLRVLGSAALTARVSRDNSAWLNENGRILLFAAIFMFAEEGISRFEMRPLFSRFLPLMTPCPNL